MDLRAMRTRSSMAIRRHWIALSLLSGSATILLIRAIPMFSAVLFVGLSVYAATSPGRGLKALAVTWLLLMFSPGLATFEYAIALRWLVVGGAALGAMRGWSTEGARPTTPVLWLFGFAMAAIVSSILASHLLV